MTSNTIANRYPKRKRNQDSYYVAPGLHFKIDTKDQVPREHKTLRNNDNGKGFEEEDQSETETDMSRHDVDEDFEDDEEEEWSLKNKRKQVKKSKKAIQATSQTPEPSDPQHIFKFLELPGELRNLIYHYALVSEGGIVIDGRVTRRLRNTPSRSDRSRMVSLVPALLAVNKQIHSEAYKILYSNKFTFDGYNAFIRFSSTIPADALEYMRSVRHNRVTTEDSFDSDRNA